MTEMKLSNIVAGNLENLSFDITRKGLYGIIGRNGAGKSTLFTLINGEMKLKSGKISGFNRSAYVPNLAIFDENLTAQDYILTLSKDEQEKATAMIQDFAANSFVNKKIKTYSLGMKEIFAFIMTLSISSDLVIVDELMNGMDYGMRKLAFGYLKSISQEKIVLLTSHILEKVYQYSDKIYLLNDSKLAEMPSLEVAKDIMQKNKAFV